MLSSSLIREEVWKAPRNKIFQNLISSVFKIETMYSKSLSKCNGVSRHKGEKRELRLFFDFQRKRAPGLPRHLTLPFLATSFRHFGPSQKHYSMNFLQVFVKNLTFRTRRDLPGEKLGGNCFNQCPRSRTGIEGPPSSGRPRQKNLRGIFGFGSS